MPPLLAKVGDGKPSIVVEGGKRQFFGTDGQDYHDLVRPDGVLLLEDIKLASKPLLKNGSAASLWDIGDGVVCLEFTVEEAIRSTTRSWRCCTSRSSW